MFQPDTCSWWFYPQCLMEAGWISQRLFNWYGPYSILAVSTSLTAFPGSRELHAKLELECALHIRVSSSPLNRMRPHLAYSRIDISDEFSFSHMLEFSKLAVAFAIELGGWTE